VKKFLTRYETLAAEPARRRARELGRPEREIPRSSSAPRAIREETECCRRKARARIVDCSFSTGAASHSLPARLVDSPSYTLNPRKSRRRSGRHRLLRRLSPVAVDVTNLRRGGGIRFARESGLGGRIGRALAAGGTPCSSPPENPAETRARREDAATSSSTTIFPACDERRPREAQRGSQARAADVLLSRFSDGRSSASSATSNRLLRQRRQGARFGTPGLPGGVARAGEDASGNPRAPPGSFRHARRPVLATFTKWNGSRHDRGVWVKAPLAARKFRPGQFYRLQNFETLSLGEERHPTTRPAMEGLG